MPSPALAPDPARLSPFRDERVVLTLFSPAMIAGEPLPHLTNFHDLLTNIHQTPSAIAGAKRSPPVRCVQAPVHRVVHMPWQILLSNEVSCASTGERSPHTVGQICVRERGACRCSSSPGDWDRMTGLARFEASLLSVRGHCRKRISCPHHEDETPMVSPNICDDKQGFAKYVWKKLPEIFDDKSDITLNTAELLPNISDNHQ